MMRFDNTGGLSHQAQKVPQDLQSDLAGFLRVELDAGHMAALHDGQRFLMLKQAGDPNATPASMVVVEHWFEDLKARVPVTK